MGSIPLTPGAITSQLIAQEMGGIPMMTTFDDSKWTPLANPTSNSDVK